MGIFDRSHVRLQLVLKRVGRYAAPALRFSIALGTTILCTAAGGSSPTYTLVVGAPVQLGAIPGTPMYGYSPISGLIADVNGDGAPDIVLGIKGESPVVYLNNGTSNPFEGVQGAFVTPPNPKASLFTFGTAVLADVNGDGHPDLAVAGFNGSSMVYLNNGTSTPFAGVQGVPIGTQDVAFTVAFGDLNGDGFLDMAIVNTNHVPSRVYLSHGAPLTAGTYTTAQIGTDVGYGQDVKIADVNGDGRPDLILAYDLQAVGDPSGIAIYLNNGTEDPFADVTPIRLLVGEWVNAVAIADLNNDGKADLVAVVSNSAVNSGTQYVFLNSGSSSAPFSNMLALQPDNDLGGGCLNVSVADLNSDGFPDLLFSCFAPTSASGLVSANAAAGAIYLNNGTSHPFNNVAPVDIPAVAYSGYGRSIATGKLVTGAMTDILLVGDQQPPNYYPTAVDQVPTAQNDSAVCPMNTSIVIAVLANDSAATGESLSVGSLTVTTPAQHGTATVNPANGLVTYLPATGYSGTDSFQYTVRDNVGGLSNVASVNVSVEPVVPTPVFFPAGGAYSETQSLNIGDSVSTAAIYYTTNGSSPTAASTKYTGAITVSASETVRAIAVVAGNVNSAIASASFDIGARPVINLSPVSLEFPSTAVGSSSAPLLATIRNTGTSVVAISSISVTGAQGDDFALTQTCGSSLAIGASCTVSAIFKPVAMGNKSASISIVDNATGSQRSVAMTGTGTAGSAAPAVTVSPTSLSFASQPTGTASNAQKVTITNTGTANLAFSAISILGVQADDFNLSRSCGTSLAIGASCSLSIVFKPVAAGAKSASIAIVDNASNSRQSIALTGTAAAAAMPSVSLSASSLNFASQSVGTASAAQTVTLTNTGTAALTVSSMAVAGVQADDFILSKTCGASLAVGASCSLSITFNPVATGAKSASVTILDNASGSRQAVALTGTGN